MKNLISISVAENYNFKKIEKYIKENSKNYKKYNEFFLLFENNTYILIYNYGSIVIWGNADIKDTVINKFKKFEINPYKIIEEYYNYKTEATKLSINNDTFNIPNLSEKNIIPISYALSQSIKLNYFEEEVENEIKKTNHIPHDLKIYGKIKLKAKNIIKLRGELLLTKSLLNLHYDLLDEPDFFWDYPELVEYYEITKNYLDINDRIEILNKKLDVLEEIFEILTDEVNHKHEVFLEWIIIILIVIEVFISLFHEILKIF